MADVLRETFREEASELLAALEGSLLELEASPQDPELIGYVFRQMHTIKGSGAMFDFVRIASFTHEIETVFDKVRSGELRVTHELINLSLKARDHIRVLLESEFGGPPADEALHEQLLGAFRAMGAGGRPAPQPEAPVKAVATEGPARYHIFFRPSPNLFLEGGNPQPLLLELCALSDADEECVVTVAIDALPTLEALNPELCYLAWNIELTTSQGENAIRDVFLFVEDDSELKIERASEESAPAPEAAPPQEAVPASVPAAGGASKSSGATIRVKSEKLDSLVNTVGELVTAQARLSQIATASGIPEFEAAAEEIERLIARLRGDAMSVRMLVIGESFGRLRRLVRDLGRDLGKEVELVTEGEDTELDKNVLEQLNDPLVHIIRNSLDHGIETPEERVAAGKPRAGTVRLSAVHSGAHVLIRISDDGAGLDRDRILAKAISKGIVGAGEELSEREIFGLIFRPGFSTAGAVTEISGRGVGLDVVSKALSALRGSVEVRSVKGQGATFTLKIPLTLAIIHGLLVSVGSDSFIMPVSNLLECVELTPESIERARGRQAVVVRDELIPYIRLRDYFEIEGEAPSISQVMIAETDNGKFGFVVDCVLGDQQTVIKNLGHAYRHVEAVSGATILGDGTVALILDVNKIASAVLAEAGRG